MHCSWRGLRGVPPAPPAHRQVMEWPAPRFTGTMPWSCAPMARHASPGRFDRPALKAVCPSEIRFGALGALQRAISECARDISFRIPPKQSAELSLRRSPRRCAGDRRELRAAVALWCGHRASVDFDFSTDRQLNHGLVHQELQKSGSAARVVQEEKDSLSLFTEPGNVKLSFFGGEHGAGGCTEPDRRWHGFGRIAARPPGNETQRDHAASGGQGLRRHRTAATRRIELEPGAWSGQVDVWRRVSPGGVPAGVDLLW